MARIGRIIVWIIAEYFLGRVHILSRPAQLFNLANLSHFLDPPKKQQLTWF
ncbi:MAG: hypothetical protein PWP41_303 [Moorella sp. (in: firmicutes)]|uniref:Uncharacterized protein n=1 Tax=Neomoorella thermoacetica TaxID=1525 RepID=A0A1J5NUK0_NEOTH|nr:hypothetical protein [Moorella sp. (in: firmicutes)]OIQ59455.1 hypothetical protein MOTE_11350 [Moorella thermoacetica]